MNHQQRRGGLGRGLGQLIQNTETETTPKKKHRPVDELIDSEKSHHKMPKGASFAEIPVKAVSTNPKQPRTEFDDDELRELSESIQEVGLLQPIVVRPLPPEGNEERFELVMGERRWRATQLAGRTTIPAIVRPTEEHDLLRDALLENLHRAQLNPLEEANAYQQLLDDFDCTQEELATRIKRSRPQISNTIRLLRLPASVQRRVAAGVLSAGHARALLSLSDQLAMERLAQRIVAEGLSVRATEELITLGETGKEPKPKRTPPEKPARALELADRLSDHFETRTRVDMGKNKGKIVIEFASAEDLERIVELMRLRQQ